MEFYMDEKEFKNEKDTSASDNDSEIIQGNENIPTTPTEPTEETDNDSASIESNETNEDAECSEVPEADENTNDIENNEPESPVITALERPKKSGAMTYAIVMTSAFAVALIMLVLTLVFGRFSAPDTSVGQLNQYESLADLYEDCYPSYVAISIVKDGTSGVGSGIILTKEGHIVTNYHVVEKSETITVHLSNGKTHPATYLDGDELNDIAVIKIEAPGLTPAKIGSSKNLRVGDRVMAIGTPQGISYAGTMTSGYVSALDRKLVESNSNGTVSRVFRFIQTDTSVNPGNSGGPLFDMNGNVVGIVSMKIIGGGYEGLGFAIPIEGVIDMINDAIDDGVISDHTSGSATEGAALGLTGYDVKKDTRYIISGDYHYELFTDENGEYMKYYPNPYLDIFEKLYIDDEDALADADITIEYIYTAPETGVRVVGTTEGFDSAVKLKEDDIITSVNGADCSDIDVLKSVVANSVAGDELHLTVFRNGKTENVSVILGRSADME